jgi:hypothetical protein
MSSMKGPNTISTANASAHGCKADSCSGLDLPRCVLWGSIASAHCGQNIDSHRAISNAQKTCWKPGIPAELLIKRLMFR